MSTSYIKKHPLTAAEYQALRDISAQIVASPKDIYSIILSESVWDPQVINSIGYGGLIQFGHAAAKELGFSSTAQLLQEYPDRISQLKGPVLQYFLKAKAKQVQRGLIKMTSPLSLSDLVSLVFYPAYFRQPNKALPQNVQDANNGIYSINNYIERLTKQALKAYPFPASELGKLAVISLPFAIAIGTALWYIFLEPKTRG